MHEIRTAEGVSNFHAIKIQIHAWNCSFLIRLGHLQFPQTLILILGTTCVSMVPGRTWTSHASICPDQCSPQAKFKA